MTDLEKIIADLVDRKNDATIDSAEWTVANNALTVLRYSSREAADLIDDLDPLAETTYRHPAVVVALPSPGLRPKVLSFRRAANKKAKKRCDKTRP